jgi:hypothetical protein
MWVNVCIMEIGGGVYIEGMRAGVCDTHRNQDSDESLFHNDNQRSVFIRLNKGATSVRQIQTRKKKDEQSTKVRGKTRTKNK